jgi:hypothetical protein
MSLEAGEWRDALDDVDAALVDASQSGTADRLASTR